MEIFSLQPIQFGLNIIFNTSIFVCFCNNSRTDIQTNNLALNAQLSTRYVHTIYVHIIVCYLLITGIINFSLYNSVIFTQTTIQTVSYTHLDVYKRQIVDSSRRC